MINITSTQKRNIWTPNIPSTWDEIDYRVFRQYQGDLIFQGRCVNTGDFQLDMNDWIEQIWDETDTRLSYTPQSLYVTAQRAGGSPVDMVSSYFSTDRMDTGIISNPTPNARPGHFDIIFQNSDFKGYTTTGQTEYNVKIPLQSINGVLNGKTINKLDKVTYTDKFGDTHNSMADNHIEVECYVDASYLAKYLNIRTGDDEKYNQLMMMAQTARNVILKGNGKISGISQGGSLRELYCRVKDVEQTETHFRYSVTNHIPTLKFTLEIYK